MKTFSSSAPSVLSWEDRGEGFSVLFIYDTLAFSSGGIAASSDSLAPPTVDLSKYQVVFPRGCSGGGGAGGWRETCVGLSDFCVVIISRQVMFPPDIRR